MTDRDEEGAAGAAGGGRGPRRQRKQTLLRLDPAVYDALARWAGEELRSANAQIEFLLRKALSDAGRLPGTARPIPRRGRPPRAADGAAGGAAGSDGPDDSADGESGGRTPQ
ncbi:hypothetical protein ABZ370_42195 [Streptomyces sp. NPDC005962]|uniref:hypothetical protein n=1 Tax=Streptomyces sp. NPDC005962 TaxID=3154466 RepID=UPI0033DEB32B